MLRPAGSSKVAAGGHVGRPVLHRAVLVEDADLPPPPVRTPHLVVIGKGWRSGGGWGACAQALWGGALRRGLVVAAKRLSSP